MSRESDEPRALVKKVTQLKVYQIAFQLAIEIHKATLEFPKIEQYALADQMRRASKSICANIAEGFAKQAVSKAEFRRFLSMAIGSGVEMETWIAFAYELGYISISLTKDWQDGYDHVLRMLEKLKSPPPKPNGAQFGSSAHRLIEHTVGESL